MLRYVVGLTVIAVLPTAVRAAPAPPGLPLDLTMQAPGAWLLVSIRVADVWKTDAARGLRVRPDKREGLDESIRQAVGLDVTDIERFTFVAGADGALVVVRTVKPTDSEQLRRRMGPQPVLLHGPVPRHYRDESTWHSVVFLDDHTFAWGASDVVEETLELRALAGPLHQARRMAASSEQHLVIGIDAALIKDLRDKLEAAGVPAALLAARSVVLTARYGTGMDVGLRFDLTDTEAADRALEALPALRTAWKRFIGGGASADGKEDEPEQITVKAIDGALDAMRSRRDGAVVRATSHVEGKDLAWSLVGLEGLGGLTHTRWSDLDSSRNLAQIGKALLDYHARHRRLPSAALRGKDGKALLSWRVALLPYLGEEKLYKEFRLDEAWDGPHNRRLVRRMPAVFRSDAGQAPVTHLQVVTGKGTAFDGPDGLRLSDMTDGPERTLLVAEARRAAPWTKPDELVYGPAMAVPRFGGVDATSFNFVCGDGKVRKLEHGHCRRVGPHGLDFYPRKDFDDRLLRSYLTRAGGEKVDVDKVFCFSDLLDGRPGAGVIVVEPPKR